MSRAPIPDGLVLIDRRKTAAQAHGPRGKWPVARRRAAAVNGVCLHQTACVLGERPERWDSVGAHVGITRSGRVIWLHDWGHRVAHGNAFNASTIGIEVDGLFAGVKDDPSTVWDDLRTPRTQAPQHPTTEQIVALHAVIRWIHADLVKLGGKLEHVFAHRQSSRSRRSDPGSEIWERGALPMLQELGLSDGGPGYVRGGLPIPQAWDPTRAGVSY